MSTMIIGGLVLALITLAGFYAFKNRKKHACCGDCDSCCASVRIDTDCRKE